MKSTMLRDYRNFSSAHCSTNQKITRLDGFYSQAKRVQLVDKDLERAILLFREAINAGDHVESALKDMACVMKQLRRPEEAIEAINLLRDRCSDQTQESMDNILLGLYKYCGRLDEQIALLEHKIELINHGIAFNGRRTKIGRSGGKKIRISIEKEKSRCFGNIGRALMQKENYKEAEVVYRRALTEGYADNIKICNLGFCVLMQRRIYEAGIILNMVSPAESFAERQRAKSQIRAYARAQQILCYLESNYLDWDGQYRKVQQNAFSGSPEFWQQPPGIEFAGNRETKFVDQISISEFRICTPKKTIGFFNHFLNIGGTAKSITSGNIIVNPRDSDGEVIMGNKKMSFSVSPEINDFEDARVRDAYLPVLNNHLPRFDIPKKKKTMRLKVFEDITPSGVIP